MTDHVHQPMIDPRTNTPVAIGGLMNALRAHVCRDCGLLYIDDARRRASVEKWKATISEESDGSDDESQPSAMRRRTRLGDDHATISPSPSGRDPRLSALIDTMLGAIPTAPSDVAAALAHETRERGVDCWGTWARGLTNPPEPRTVRPWTTMPCDACGCDHEATRTTARCARVYLCATCSRGEDGTGWNPVPVADPMDAEAYRLDCARRQVDPGPMPSMEFGNPETKIVHDDGIVSWKVYDRHDGGEIYIRVGAASAFVNYAGRVIVGVTLKRCTPTDIIRIGELADVARCAMLLRAKRPKPQTP